MDWKDYAGTQGPDGKRTGILYQGLTKRSNKALPPLSGGLYFIKLVKCFTRNLFFILTKTSLYDTGINFLQLIKREGQSNWNFVSYFFYPVKHFLKEKILYFLFFHLQFFLNLLCFFPATGKRPARCWPTRPRRQATMTNIVSFVIAFGGIIGWVFGAIHLL